MLTSSPRCGWNSNRCGCRKSCPDASRKACLSARWSSSRSWRLTASRHAWRDCRTLLSADTCISAARRTVLWNPKSIIYDQQLHGINNQIGKICWPSADTLCSRPPSNTLKPNPSPNFMNWKMTQWLLLPWKTCAPVLGFFSIQFQNCSRVRSLFGTDRQKNEQTIPVMQPIGTTHNDNTNDNYNNMAYSKIMNVLIKSQPFTIFKTWEGIFNDAQRTNPFNISRLLLIVLLSNIAKAIQFIRVPWCSTGKSLVKSIRQGINTAATVSCRLRMHGNTHRITT